MQLYHSNYDKTRLLIFFAGFWTDNNCFLEFDNKKSDILYVFDYSCLDFYNLEYFDFSPYSEINLIAYSYGVFASNLAYKFLPYINKSCAISGTIYPISEEYGINPKIYDLMLNSFDENVILNFKKKMEFNSGGIIANSKRSVENLKKELLEIKEYCQNNKIEKNFEFDSCILTKKDKIIPFSAQNSYWQFHSAKTVLDCGHFPFFMFKDFDEILDI